MKNALTLKQIIIVALVFLFGVQLSLSSVHAAGDWYVNPGQSIQYAIDAASSAGGGTVHAAAGTYSENITLRDGVAVMGAGPAVTTIDGDGDTVVTANGVGSSAVLDGFTITGATTLYANGMFNQYASPKVNNCIFVGNGDWDTTEGGGMRNIGSSPHVTNCIFKDNVANDGGGMLNDDSNPTLYNCALYHNNANYTGDGIYNKNASSPVFINCTIAHNYGEGIYNTGSSCAPSLTNCIVWGNVSGIVWGGSSTITYSNIQGGWGGTGNINADPLFIDPDNGDFRLMFDSPCIDAGDNASVPAEITTDLDGNPRIADGDLDGTAVVDMGAYEIEIPVLGPSGGTVTGPGGVVFSVGPGVLAGDVNVLISILDAIVGDILVTPFVGITFLPDNPSPLSLPGAAITMPLLSEELLYPLAPGNPVMLVGADDFEYPSSYTLDFGTVDEGGTTATFEGVTNILGIFVGCYGPSITVSIASSETNVDPGSTVTLTVSMKNEGFYPLAEPYVELAVQGNTPWITLDNESASFVGGDTNNDGYLDDETWTWEVTGVVVESSTTYEATGHASFDAFEEPFGIIDITYPAFPTARSTVTVSIPTLIQLADLTATPAGSGIAIAWVTDSEINNAGFNVYRALSPLGPYTKINKALIPARGSAVSGASYEFIDNSARAGIRYFYKLEDIDFNGSQTLHGPVNARISILQRNRLR